MQQPEEDASDKPHAPSARKLDEARRKGEVPRSTDLNAAAGFAGILLAMLAFGATTTDGMGGALSILIAQADSLAPLFFEGAPEAPTAGLLRALLAPLAIWFGLPALGVLLSVLAQRSFLVTPSKLAPKLSRISPIANAKNKFGRNGLFEFAKSFAKLVIFSVCLAWMLQARLPEIVASQQLDPRQSLVFMARLARDFLVLVVLVAFVIGALDYFWQLFEHQRRHRMSHKELRDESKETEGDPWLKQERRNRGQAIAANRMLADVPRADVVIVNPTHYAVALTWSRKRGEAPVCVAKGVDAMARRIRELAQEAGVPIRSDPPAARALHAGTEIGAQISPAHYHAVAAAIRFAEDMRRRARARG
ncbi:MAG: flagellar biosynthesis protein FlhB [Paracoccaceae bacterium]